MSLSYSNPQGGCGGHFYNSIQVCSQSDWYKMFISLADFLQAPFVAFPALILADFFVIFSSQILTSSLILKGFNIGHKIIKKLLSLTAFV